MINAGYPITFYEISGTHVIKSLVILTASNSIAIKETSNYVIQTGFLTPSHNKNISNIQYKRINIERSKTKTENILWQLCSVKEGVL
jgi:hypothetical protein